MFFFKFFLKKFLFAFLLLIFPLFINPKQTFAWTKDIHNYLCPQELNDVEEGCNLADKFERLFQEFPLNQPFHHLCLDDNPNCPAKNLAKYYVKKYYVEGKRDKKLLALAAHIFQDYHCPDHWFPMREIAGRIFVPFAPSWVGKTEGEVSKGVSEYQSTGGKAFWQVERVFKGKKIILNQEYIDNLKRETERFIKTEPIEDLQFLENQIKTKSFWQYLRSFREWAILGLIILLPFLVFYFFKWKGSKTGKTDLTVTALVSLLLSVYIFLTFYY